MHTFPIVRGGVKFEAKWYLPLNEVSFKPPEDSADRESLSIRILQYLHVCTWGEGHFSLFDTQSPLPPIGI